VFRISIFLVVLFLITNCKKDKQNQVQTSQQAQDKLKIGLIIGLGGFGDRAFNDMQYNGMIMAQKKYNVIFEYREPKIYDHLAIMMEDLIASDCEVIICSSFDHIELVDKTAPKYPHIKFVLIDEFLKTMYPNTASLTFRQNEGSFLVGALAGLMTTTNVIGAIGGMNIPVINDFFVGYQAGARYTNPDITVLQMYINEHDPDHVPWANPVASKEMSLTMMDEQNADIIFGVAAASNLGIFQAAKMRKKYAIGVDADQDYLEAGTILISMMKNLDMAVVYIIGEIIAGRFESKKYILGLKENGVGLSPMEFTKNLIPKKHLMIIENLKEEIISGKRKIPTVYH
ncbi:MAG: BMP family ABC transporter substrate-binding protein, partial [Spirochaetes bacterium]|nr:BMP family ABC transporter substrate-binding protein [Spirochaetota bacterium]